MTGREVYEFAGFALDATERRLSKAGLVVPLAPKAHDLLVALVRNAGRFRCERLGKPRLVQIRCAIWKMRSAS